MGYYVIMNDIAHAEEEIGATTNLWLTQMEELGQVLVERNAGLRDTGCGELVEAVCSYVEEVHIYLLEQFKLLITEFFERFVTYAEGYYEIEPEIFSGEIAQESLENQQEVLADGKEAFLLEAEELEKKVQEISDLISAAVPTTGSVESGFELLTGEAEKLRVEIGEHEAKHQAGDFEYMETMLEEMENLIAGLSGKNRIQIESYKKEDILQFSQVDRLKTTGQSMAVARGRNAEKVEKAKETYSNRGMVIITNADSYGEVVACAMDTPGGEVQCIKNMLVDPFLRSFVLAKLLRDVYSGDTTIEESLSESLEFTKGCNEVGIQVVEETVGGVVGLPGGIKSLIGQIQENGIIETGSNIINGTIENIKAIWTEDVVYGDWRSRGNVVGRIGISLVEIGVSLGATKVAIGGAKIIGKGLKTVENVEDVVDAVDDVGDAGRAVRNVEGGLDIVEDITEAARKTQKSIIESVENSAEGTKGLTNLQKGNYGEMKMDYFFESQGYDRISTDRVTDLNEPTHQGIDGVYYNPDGHPPYIIGEAKYGSAKLSTLADGTQQMSDKWIIDRLENAVGEEIANDIKMEMILNPDNVGSSLVHISPDGSIDITELIDGVKY